MSEQHPKIYLLPNLMTAGNLFCGFTATLKILEGALLQASNPDAAGDLFHAAIWFILGACFFDLLDGLLHCPARISARLLDYRIYLSRLWRASPGALQLPGGES